MLRAYVIDILEIRSWLWHNLNIITAIIRVFRWPYSRSYMVRSFILRWASLILLRLDRGEPAYCMILWIVYAWSRSDSVLPKVGRRPILIKKIWPLEFMVGDQVFLWVFPMKGVMRFWRRDNFSSRFIDPFEILKRIGEVAYKIALPQTLSSVNHVFHISMLRWYVLDKSHVF